MAGCELKEGKYEDRILTEDELWSALMGVFSPSSKKDTTYKFGFLKSIIDNTYNVDENYQLTFDQLFGKFTEIYWNLILKYKLRQKAPNKVNRTTYLEQILYATKEKYLLQEHIPFESLPEEYKQETIRQVKIKCKQNVVGALYGDTKGQFYSFSKKEEWIKLNPQMHDFICKHKLLIEKINYFEWAKFLEAANDESDSLKLLSKLDASSKRNNLSVYRQILLEEFGFDTCFYCGKKLKQDNIHVDHFIPWAFIKDDNIWNFVLACPKCNESKNDKLPDIMYLDALIERNESMLLEYMNEKNINYNNNTLRHIYNWAQVNGYNKKWTVKK
jgi:hypothetical protein